MWCCGMRLVRKLGQGSFGVVYEAQEPGTDRRWALKMERVAPKTGAREEKAAAAAAAAAAALDTSMSSAPSSRSLSSSSSSSSSSSLASLYLRSRSGAGLSSASRSASSSSCSSSGSATSWSSSAASSSSSSSSRQRSVGSSVPSGVSTESLLEAAITCELRHPNVLFTKSVQLDPRNPTRVVTICELGRQTLQEYLDLDPNRDDLDASRAAVVATAAKVPCATRPAVRTTRANKAGGGEKGAGGGKGKKGETGFRAVPLGTATLASYLSLIGDMVRGLAYVHSRRIAHFDLKPENILLFDASSPLSSPPPPDCKRPTQSEESTGEKGGEKEKEEEEEEEEEGTRCGAERRGWVAKLADFGLAERITELEPDQQIGGTLHYNPPENLCPETRTRRHAFAKDHWSLLVIIWSMLFGCHPFVSRAEFQRMTHERDMLHHVFRRLGWPSAPWLRAYVDADARSRLRHHATAVPAAPPTTRTTAVPATRSAAAKRRTSSAHADVIVRLLRQRTGLSYGRWCASYGEPLMAALVRMFARGFVYDPAERAFDYGPVWRATREPRAGASFHAAPGPGPEDEREDDAEAHAAWFRRVRKRLPLPIARRVWEIWCLLLDLKFARVTPDEVDAGAEGGDREPRPQQLEYDAVVSLATKLAGFKNDLCYVCPRDRLQLRKTYLRELYARQNQIIDRLDFRFSRPSPSLSASSADLGDLRPDAGTLRAPEAQPEEEKEREEEEEEEEEREAQGNEVGLRLSGRPSVPEAVLIGRRPMSRRFAR